MLQRVPVSSVKYMEVGDFSRAIESLPGSSEGAQDVDTLRSSDRALAIEGSCPARPLLP